jgi:hypothetical protein
MSRKERGFEMGIGKVGSILAPTLFVLYILVALARVPGKITTRQRLYHTRGVSQTQIDPKKCIKCLLVAKFHIDVQTDLTKKRIKKKVGILTKLSHNHDWNYWCHDGLSC